MPRGSDRWIYTRACDFAPDGSLQLGQILAEPKDPAYVLQPNGPLKFHDGMKVEHGERIGCSMRTNDELTAHFRGWARSSKLPAGLGVGWTKKQSREHLWHFEKLESSILSPPLAYTAEAMEHGDVRATLRSRRFKRHVYMVTGVRIARGARLHHLDKDHFRFAADTQTDMPEDIVTLGATAAMGQKKLDSEKFSRASDFVFAYRLNEVSYRGILSQRPYLGGEVASADAPYVGYEPPVVVDDFEVLGLEDTPFEGDPDDFDAIYLPGYEDLVCYIARNDVDECVRF